MRYFFDDQGRIRRHPKKGYGGTSKGFRPRQSAGKWRAFSGCEDAPRLAAGSFTLVTNMSRKVMIMVGMIIGSFAGWYLPGFLGAGGISLASLLGSGAGGILGIWIAFQLTR